MLTALTLVLSLAMLPFSVFADGQTGSDGEPNSYKGSLSNWMASIPDNILLSELNIPGTHDSGTCYSLSEVYYTQCHDLQIDEQLERGIRVFDIRLDCGYYSAFRKWLNDEYSIDYTDLNLQHGPFTCFKDLSHELYFTDVLNWVQRFLKTYPSETVVLKVTNECNLSTGDSGSKLVKEALRDFAKNYADSYNAICYTGSEHAEVPTLGSVRGKMLILTDYDGKTLTKYEDHCEIGAPEKVKYLKECFDNSTRLQRFCCSESDFKPVFRTQNLENGEKGKFGEPDVKFVFTSSNTFPDPYGGPGQ